MKEILVCVDFSKSSLNAMKYAVLIANKRKCNILMVWVNKPDKSDSVLPYDNPAIKQEIKSKFDEWVLKFDPMLKTGKVHYKMRKGKVYQEIVNQAKYDDAYMIVAGTHGVSGFEEYWIGSNAYRIVTYAPCPVITVRQSFNVKKSISKIVLPIDSTIETRQKVPFAMELARPFNAEIHVLALYSSSVKTIKNKVDSYAKQVGMFLAQEGVPFKIEGIEAPNVTNATIEYAVGVNADMIAIMTEQESSASNIWLGTYAQQMVNHSPIPVLNIHPKELVTIFSK